MTGTPDVLEGVSGVSPMPCSLTSTTKTSMILFHPSSAFPVKRLLRLVYIGSRSLFPTEGAEHEPGVALSVGRRHYCPMPAARTSIHTFILPT